MTDLFERNSEVTLILFRLCTVIEQNLEKFRAVLSWRQAQGRFSPVVSYIRVRSIVQKDICDFELTIKRGDMERCPTTDITKVNGKPGMKQHLDNFFETSSRSCV